MINTQDLKKKLEDEKVLLESELRSIGRVNPDNPKDWEAKPVDLDLLPSDENDMADGIEELENNTAVLKELEIRYNQVKEALSRIETDTYGKCEISGEAIEEERLEANPAARTCIAHKERESELN